MSYIITNYQLSCLLFGLEEPHGDDVEADLPRLRDHLLRRPLVVDARPLVSHFSPLASEVPLDGLVRPETNLRMNLFSFTIILHDNNLTKRWLS